MLFVRDGVQYHCLLGHLQLKRLNELEDIVAEQDNALAALREKLAREREDNQMLKIKFEDTQRRHAEEKDK